MVTTFIRQGKFMEALQVLETLKTQDKKFEITRILLALNLKKHSNGESKISKIIKSVLEETTCNLLPLELNLAVESLMIGELDDSLIVILWKYLMLDQQQLLLILCI